MSIEMLSEDDRGVPNPTWSTITEAFERVSVGHSKSLLLEGFGDAWLATSHVVDHGLQVMAIEDGEQAELVLTQRGAGLGLMSVVVAGVPQQESTSTLVPITLALEAVRFFAETGKRSPNLSWQDPFEVERRAAAAS